MNCAVLHLREFSQHPDVSQSVSQAIDFNESTSNIYINAKIVNYQNKMIPDSVADPGFPVGGDANPLGGGGGTNI